jgi:hypothetical protein
VITRESAMLCNSSWQAIKNQEYEVDGEQALTGVVYFYREVCLCDRLLQMEKSIWV